MSTTTTSTITHPDGTSVTITTGGSMTTTSSVSEQASPLTPREQPLRSRSSDFQRPSSSAPAVAELVLISDPGQDLDDEMAFIMLRHLIESHGVELKGVVTTLAPAFDRARCDFVDSLFGSLLAHFYTDAHVVASSSSIAHF